MDKKKLIIIISIVLILLFGISGLMIFEGYDFLNSLFFTLVMFLGNYSDPTTNIFVNIARYGALLVTATAVLFLLQNVYKYIVDYIRSKKNNSIFVFGENKYSEEFIRSTKLPIVNRNNFIKTNSYVLLSTEDENTKFYNENKEKLTNKNVYIKNNTFSNQILNDGYLHYFSLEYLAARKYWKNNSLIEIALPNTTPKKELNIALVGFNILAEQILYQALMINIFDPKQKVNYHVFGNSDKFVNEHRNTKELRINFYENSILAEKKIANKIDKILFFASADELVGLIGNIDKANITFFTDDDSNLNQFINHKYGVNNNIKLDVFNYSKEICTEENIINEEEIYNAKLLNASYGKLVNNNASKDEQWRNLSTFHRYSNIACIDYFMDTITKLIEIKTNKKLEEINDKEFSTFLPLLSELEHIRWCNYYWYCNWIYNDKTDKNIKHHNCLIPYSKLPKKEKEKDANQIITIKDLINN